MNEGQAPSIFIQNENLNIPLGKGADIINRSVTGKKKNRGGLKERKALAHLSGVPKGPKPLASQSTVIKNTKETINKKQPLKKETLLSEDDIKNCHGWAREGIEYCPFTLNDAHRLEKNAFDLRVKNEVDLVVGSMKVWSDTCFNDLFDLPRSRPSEAPKDIDDTLELRLEPEITSECTNAYFSDNDEYLDALFNTDDDDVLFNIDSGDHFVLMASPTSTAI